MTTTIGNTVQCGIYMVKYAVYRNYAVNFSGYYSDIGIPTDDQYWVIYPGFQAILLNSSGTVTAHIDNSSNIILKYTSTRNTTRTVYAYYMYKNLTNGPIWPTWESYSYTKYSTLSQNINGNIYCSNTVQCGVFMQNGNDTSNDIYAIPFTGTFYDYATAFPNDADDFWIVYPGFRVITDDGAGVKNDFNNTTGTTIKRYAISPANKTSSVQVYYMNTPVNYTY